MNLTARNPSEVFVPLELPERFLDLSELKPFIKMRQTHADEDAALNIIISRQRELFSYLKTATPDFVPDHAIAIHTCDPRYEHSPYSYCDRMHFRWETPEGSYQAFVGTSEAGAVKGVTFKLPEYLWFGPEGTGFPITSTHRALAHSVCTSLAVFAQRSSFGESKPLEKVRPLRVRSEGRGFNDRAKPIERVHPSIRPYRVQDVLDAEAQFSIFMKWALENRDVLTRHGHYCHFLRELERAEASDAIRSTLLRELEEIEKSLTPPPSDLARYFNF